MSFVDVASQALINQKREQQKQLHNKINETHRQIDNLYARQTARNRAIIKSRN